MEWAQFLILILTIGGLFLWNRSESRSELSVLRQESAADRRDILQLIRSIQEEIKDFHGRLCAIEERNKEKK